MKTLIITIAALSPAFAAMALTGADSEAHSSGGTTKGKLGGKGAIGPCWTYGACEEPAGTQNMGSYTIRVYTPEQQKRLG